MSVNECRVVTYNCHGFNQGSPYLQDLLLSNDIICIQEHWLSSSDFLKLSDLNKDFTVIASFAVDSVLGCGVLRGRPFGGLCIFVKSDLIAKLNIICKSDRLIVIQMNNLLICNVYMPCDDLNLFTDILGMISDYIVNKDRSVDHYLVAGDFNCNFLLPGPSNDVFRCFANSCLLSNTLSGASHGNLVTYRHNTLNHSSCIDYIFMSSVLCNKLCKECCSSG